MNATVDSPYGTYLAFYTADSYDSIAETAAVILRTLGNRLEAAGLSVVLTPDPQAADWEIAVASGSANLLVVMSVIGVPTPTQRGWFVCLESVKDLTIPPETSQMVHQCIEQAVSSLSPRVFGLHWHASWQTLRNI